MYLHYPVALNNSTYRLVVPNGLEFTKLVVQPDSATVYVGPAPRPAFTVVGGVGTSGAATISLRNSLGGVVPGADALRPGQLVASGALIPANTYVKSYDNGLLTLSANLAGNVTASDVLTVTETSVSATTGITVLAGGTFEYPAGWRTSGGIDIFSAGATDVRILYSFV